MWEYLQAKIATNLPKHNPHSFINPSMEPSINTQKIQAMKKHKRAALAYNLALYSLTSIITCFFFSSPFWFPSITNHLILSSFSNLISFCFNAKCFFVLGNLIVIILVGESKLKQSSSSTTTDIYDEYVARSRSIHRKDNVINGSVKTLSVEEKSHHREEEKRKKNLEIKITSMPRGGEEKKKGMRSCKSEVWGEGGMVKMEKAKGKREEKLVEGEKIKLGMRSSKSAVWSESETAKMEKAKVKKEDQSSKISKSDEGKKMGMRSSKSAVWSESERVKMERGKSKKEEEWSKNVVHEEEKKMGIRSSRSAVWGESEIADHEREKGKGIKREELHEGKTKMGMRSCRSEIWSESEIVRLGKAHDEEEQQLNVLNKRAEDFIARINKQRLLEARSVDHIHA